MSAKMESGKKSREKFVFQTQIKKIEMIKIEILGTPKPKQSARFRIIKTKAGGQFISSYQNKEVKDTEANIGYTAIQQLPANFKPFDCPISAYVEYIFPLPLSFPKKKIEAIKSGERIYKDTKPDLSDNLNKGLIDALSGIVYINDSRIVSMAASKYYGLIPKTIIYFCETNEADAIHLYNLSVKDLNK